MNKHMAFTDILMKYYFKQKNYKKKYQIVDNFKVVLY